METMKSGSSALALVLLALKSAKVIHESLNTIKDAPRVVGELSHDIQLLQSVLQRLSHCSLTQVSGTTIISLEEMLKTCAAELGSIETRLMQFSAKPNGGRSNRVFKGILAVIKKEDLEEARHRIRDKTTQANLYLGLIQAQAISDTSAKIDSQASATTGILERILAEVSSLHMRLDNNTIASNLKVQPTLAKTEMDATSETVAADLEAMAICSELEESISRLSSLVDRGASTLEAEDAEQIIDDLQRIILIAKDKACGSKGRVYPNVGMEDAVSLRRDLKLVEGLILSAPILAINKPAPNSKQLLANIPKGAIIKQKRLREEIDVKHGSLIVSTNKRRRICQTSLVDSSGSIATYRDVIANIMFRPSGSSWMFSVSVSQGQLFDRSIQSIPRISACPIVPNDSLVFRLVREGQLNDFRMLLKQGKASLRDHDEDGLSLLHYAATGSVEMCKFLLESGADVDEMGLQGGTALSSTTGLDCHDTVQVLLENMADPTLSYPGWDNPLATACNSDIPSVELFLKYGSHFAMQDLENPDMNGRTRLHQVCMADSRSTSKRKAVAMLIAAGAQITARISRSWSPDDHETLGFTCLHSLVYTAHRTTDRDELETLIFLIKNKADPWAIDHHDNTVSMRAYLPNENDNHYSSKGSYRGDLWDATLIICGFDLGEFRASYPRTPRYNKNYTRKDFERLWLGNESRCPYWNDKRYPEKGGREDYWKSFSQNSYNTSCAKCEEVFVGDATLSPEPNYDDLPPYVQNLHPRVRSPSVPPSAYAEGLGSQMMNEEYELQEDLIDEGENFYNNLDVEPETGSPDDIDDGMDYSYEDDIYEGYNDSIYDDYCAGFDDHAERDISPPISENGEDCYQRLMGSPRREQDEEAFAAYWSEHQHLNRQREESAIEVLLEMIDDEG